MAAKSGSLSINSENIFPIIKKWLYSDHDIFYRELISNGCDAITKLKKLDMMGEYSLPDGYKGTVEVIADPEHKTLTFKDNGLGMTADEVEEYINQIAFSGAADFIEKYKDKSNADQIIGHFGLGFYSAFMVADEVHIDTLSYQPGAVAVHWECDGGTEFSMEDGDRAEVGTTITLFLNEDCLEFCNEYRAREVIKKYCSFMPTEIYLSKADTKETQIVKESEKREDDVVIEEIVPEKKEDDKAEEAAEEEPAEPEEKKYKIRKRPELLNEVTPLWTKHPNDCTKEEYLEFYRKVFQDYKEPLFWIHLNMDYPFNLKGILYFPKINMEYESIEGTIKLYNNQVFIADNIKEVIPEFLMLLKGVIDCPDLPLNVSRSALQNDGFVKKIAEYITKRVADKLSGMCKTEKEEYDKYWDDISPFIKFGCLKDDKFCEKMNDYILFKNLEGKYLTLPECLETKPLDVEESAENAVDENGEKVEAEIVTEEPETEGEEEAEEKPEKIVYYVTDEQQQSQYINMFKAAKMDAVILTHNIDQPFITQLEGKNEGVRFLRIDSDVTDALKAKTSKKVKEELEEQAQTVGKIMKKALKNDKITVKVEKLKNKKISSVLTLSEETRRMQDMMKMYSVHGMGADPFGGEGETLVLNANHPLVQYVIAHEDGENTAMICEQLYDLAKLQHAPLDSESMTQFVARTNDIMMLLAK
ncbi:MAG: molecular chaperone HtpG [Clostridium sp.]|nr:molecular chaperone HtpG [Acetatifactor muris]MCM1526878.1 molecular chaperone HtpG [Bacteroides sp.]MCM1563329.1 molecular chaperone HtpG [Clostridium sp.]